MKDGGKEIKKAVQASFEGNGIVGDSREEWGTEKEKAFCELLQSIRAIARTMRHVGADPYERLVPMLAGLPPEQRARAEAAIQPKRRGRRDAVRGS